MPDQHASALPQFEAFEKVLALREQRVSLCDRVFITEVRELLDGLDMAASHKIASHVVTPKVTEGVGGVP
jgi:hypothetical protein